MNRITIIGNLGNDPVMERKSNGKDVCRFRVADNNNYTRENGTKVQETEWFNCNAYDATAKRCMEMLRKGRQVYIEGRLSTSTYTGHDNTSQTSISVFVLSFMALGPRQPETQASARVPDDENTPTASPSASTATPDPVGATAAVGGPLHDYEEDDEPF